MKTIRLFIFLVYALLLAPALCAAEQSTPIQVFFSPNGGCTDAVVKTIDNAENSIYVQAYSFTSEPIADALVRAKKRGDKVIIVLDKSQLTAKNSMLPRVSAAGIPTYIDKKHAIAHNKIMVIDDRTVITGSFNFTKAAEEKNAENLLIIDSKHLAGEYRRNFLQHETHSEKYTGSNDLPPTPRRRESHPKGKNLKSHS